MSSRDREEVPRASAAETAGVMADVIAPLIARVVAPGAADHAGRRLS